MLGWSWCKCELDPRWRLNSLDWITRKNGTFIDECVIIVAQKNWRKEYLHFYLLNEMQNMKIKRYGSHISEHPFVQHQRLITTKFLWRDCCISSNISHHLDMKQISSAMFLSFVVRRRWVYYNKGESGD